MCDFHICSKLLNKGNVSKVFFVLFSSFIFQRSMIGCRSSFPSPRRHKTPLEDWTILLEADKKDTRRGDTFSQLRKFDSKLKAREKTACLTYISKARRSCLGRRRSCRCTLPSTSRPRPWQGQWSRLQPRRTTRPRIVRRKCTRHCISPRLKQQKFKSFNAFLSRHKTLHHQWFIIISYRLR